MTSLGRLKRVALRQIWNDEAASFTPWLAKLDNILLLGETLGVELEVETKEKHVGPFRADILCKDTITNNWVLIENQLEKTDHLHLGQLITYAAGLEAVTIVWIAEKFTLEHRAAIDWLNEISNERAYFFALEIELWQIDDSPVAPKFNVVSQPNDWSKTVAEVSRTLISDELSETQQMQYEFWAGFRDFLEKRGSSAKPPTPAPRHWISFAAGRSYFYFAVSMHTLEDKFTVELVLQGPDAKSHFKLLERQKEEIESEVGSPLEWRELPEKIESQIALVKKDANAFDKEGWPLYFDWLAANIEAFLKAFKPRIQKLNALDYSSFSSGE